MPKKKPMKRPILPGEKFNPETHLERRKHQQEPHAGHGWGAGPSYYRKDPSTGLFVRDKSGKKKSFPEERKK